MYQKPVIDHRPWPSSQFNKWHAQNKLLSSSLIVIGSNPWFTPPQTSELCRRKACFLIKMTSTGQYNTGFLFGLIARDNRKQKYARGPATGPPQ
jgi:hypothetical protein